MENATTTTRQLTVNAAFLKEIKDDNRELKALIGRIEPLSEHHQTARNHWAELARLVADLRDQLAVHFSLEEAYGYFDDAVDAAPQLSAAANCLRNQHSAIYERICELADCANGLQADRVEAIAEFVANYHEFAKGLQRHEEAELKLILDSLEDDIGVGD